MTLHYQIEEQSRRILACIERDDAGVLYPPEHESTPTSGYFLAERQALQELIARPEGRSALSKVIVDAAGSALISLFTLMEGITDPVYPLDSMWFGMTVEPRSADTAPPPHTFLEADFVATYDDFIRAPRPEQGRDPREERGRP